MYLARNTGIASGILQSTFFHQTPPDLYRLYRPQFARSLVKMTDSVPVLPPCKRPLKYSLAASLCRCVVFWIPLQWLPIVLLPSFLHLLSLLSSIYRKLIHNDPKSIMYQKSSASYCCHQARYVALPALLHQNHAFWCKLGVNHATPQQHVR